MTPPAGKSGREYETVDARCRACVIKGGDEEPCRSGPELRLFERKFGRPCPRVELDPDNEEAFSMCWVSLSEHTRHFAEAYGRELLRGRPAEERLAILRRVLVALNSREVTDLLYPKLPDTR